MRKEDWQEAFGRVPREFDLMVDRTLYEMEDKPVKLRSVWKKGMALALAGALAVGGAALAASDTWNVFDFINNVNMQVTDPGLSKEDMEELVQSPEFELEGKLARCRLEEVAFDGRSMNATFRITALDPEHTLLMSGYGFDPSDYVPTGNDDVPEADRETFEQKAAREGKRLVSVAAYIDSKGFEDVTSYNEHFNDDGSITMYARCLFTEDAAGQEAKSIVGKLTESDGRGGQVDTYAGDFEVKANTEMKTASASGEWQLDFLRVTGVKLSRSSLGMYASLEGVLADELTDEQAAFWENTVIALSTSAGSAADEMVNGAIAMYNAQGEQVFTKATGGERITANLQLGAGEGLPEKVWLCLHNYDDVTYGEKVEVPLEPEG